jgi:hypothetical protein
MANWLKDRMAGRGSIEFDFTRWYGLVTVRKELCQHG